MKPGNVRIILSFLIIVSGFCGQTLAQDLSPAPQFRSRSESLAERRKVENAFPDLIRVLRTLHLPPDKMSEAETKLRRSEVETRATREELQSLTQKAERQNYNRHSSDNARATELRRNLQDSTDRLQSEIKGLLTQQQRDQFDRQLKRPNPKREKETKSSH